MQTGHGGDIYSGRYELDFSANINPLGMPPAVTQAACEGVKMSVHYPDPQCRQLREAIAQADGVPARQIICGNGAAELIYALCLAQRPKEGLLIAPGFAEYEQALRAAGCHVTCYYCRRERQFRIEEDYLDCLTPATDIAFLCNPDNPTGVTLSRPFLEQVLQKCIACGTRMVLDECFIGFLDDGPERTMVSHLRETGRLFILRAFTKLYAMPGLRLGYGLCSDAALLEAMRDVCQPWNVSVPAQAAGVAALKEKEYVRKSLALIGAQRHFLEKELSGLGLKCFPPSANFIFFQGPEGLAQECGRRGILIRDCSNYTGLEKGYYRVAVRKQEENQRLLAVLRQILKP